MTKAPRTRGPTQARCPDCNGSGQKRYYTDDENDDMGVGRPRPRLMACYLCRGAGRLTVFQTYLLVAGKALRKHRHNRGLSVLEMAREIDVEPGDVQTMESGHFSIAPVVRGYTRLQRAAVEAAMLKSHEQDEHNGEPCSCGVADPSHVATDDTKG